MTSADDGIVQWFYREKEHQSNEKSILWMKYRDIEMEIIETAYQEKRSEVFLDRYRIDLKTFIQYHRLNSVTQYEVKRQIHCRREECLREERFSAPPALTTSSSYGAAQAWCPFLHAWLETSAGKQALIDFSSAINACVNGILQEAVLSCSDSQTEAKWMVEQLQAYRTKSRSEISKFCVHLYTRESFLYRVLNQALRDSDHSKLNTLGPLCFFIRNYAKTHQGFVGTVYRGVELSSTMIASYKQAETKWRTWPSFTSTTKTRKYAELFGNTLFIITIITIQFSHPIRASDVSDISQFPNEEEVLVPAGTAFRVIKVEENSCGKNIIQIEV